MKLGVKFFHNVHNLLSVSDFSKELGVPTNIVLHFFYEWCRENNESPDAYIGKIKRVKNGRVMIKTAFVLPPNAQEYIIRKIREFNGAYTIRRLAKELGVSEKRIRTEFKWWCRENNCDMDSFYVRGVGYILPPKFVEHVRKAYKLFGNGDKINSDKL